MTRLRKAVEQTVRKYENCADGKSSNHCYFCDAYPRPRNNNNRDACANCPIQQIEPYKSHCNSGCFTAGMQEVRRGAIRGDIESCLTLMVYFWGFLDAGEK